MRILAIVQGEYGRRIAENIRLHHPGRWRVETWEAPAGLPPVVDEPQEFLPAALPPADLLLSLGEHPGVAELVPVVVRRSGARAVIAPVDSVSWLPPGLKNQLAGELADKGIAAVFPKPFCSLTENSYADGQQRKEYDDPLVAEFARHFGQPRLRLENNPKSGAITSAEVVRDSACGCTRFVAGGLVGISAEEAEQEAGMLHHHYPCLASMAIDADYQDTLMHVSGNIMKEAVAVQVRSRRQPPSYLIRGDRSG